MKATIDGKRYDTNKCEVLGTHDHHNYSGNYSGTTRLLRASDGTLLLWTDTNGQDCHLCDDLRLFNEDETWSIDDFDLNDEQEARCMELGLIKVVD